MTTSTRALAGLAMCAAACGGDNPVDPDPDPGPGPSGRYSTTVRADGPVAYWRFEEASGTVAADSSGLNRPAVYINGPVVGDSLGADSTGLAMSIENADGGAFIAFAAWTDLPSLTVEVWVRPRVVTSSEGMIIVDKGSTWNLFLDPAGRPAFQFPGDVPPETLSPTPLVVGQTYYLAGTFQGGVMRLYVNGALVDEATGLISSVPANPTAMHVGRGLSGQFGFLGVIDEVALYDTALSAADILDHYNAGY